MKTAATANSDAFLDRILPGDGAAVRQLREHIYRVNTQATEVRRILLLGDPGVGKSHIARAICQHHCWVAKKYLDPKKKYSPTAQEEESKKHVAFGGVDILEESKQPLAEVLVPTLEGDIGLSELFGHTRGAYTGAVRDKTGYFGQKHLTHVFLDEIGYASKALQQRLLQICQSDKFHPLGSEQFETSDKRIIFATNLDLKTAVARNEFQPDLYWRMLNYVILIPRLANRRDEIEQLIKRHIQHLDVKVLNAQAGDSKFALTSDDMKWAVETYAWPGNVRQLLHCVERWFFFRETRSFRDVCEESQQYVPAVSTSSYLDFRREALVAHFETRLKDAARTGKNLKSVNDEIDSVSNPANAHVAQAYLEAIERCQQSDKQIIAKAFGPTAPSQRNELTRIRKNHRE